MGHTITMQAIHPAKEKELNMINLFSAFTIRTQVINKTVKLLYTMRYLGVDSYKWMTDPSIPNGHC